jgi:hypothetical protein
VLISKGAAEVLENSARQSTQAALYSQKKQDEYAATLK